MGQNGTKNVLTVIFLKGSPAGQHEEKGSSAGEGRVRCWTIDWHLNLHRPSRCMTYIPCTGGRASGAISISGTLTAEKREGKVTCQLRRAPTACNALRIRPGKLDTRPRSRCPYQDHAFPAVESIVKAALSLSETTTAAAMARAYLVVIVALAGYIAYREILLLSQTPTATAGNTNEAEQNGWGDASLQQQPIGGGFGDDESGRQDDVPRDGGYTSGNLTVEDVFEPDSRWGRHFPATDASVMIIILSGTRDGDEEQRASVFDTWATNDTFVATGGTVNTDRVIRLPPEAEEGGYLNLPRKVLT